MNATLAELPIVTPDIGRVASPERAPVKLLGSTILRGCNLHHGSTVIRQDVHLGVLAGRCSSEAGAAFAERFLQRFAHLRKLAPDGAVPQGFVERLRSASGAPFEEVLLEAMLAVETALSYAARDLYSIEFARTLPTSSPCRWSLVWECHTPKLSRQAAALGLAGCLELLPPELHPREDEPGEDFRQALAIAEAAAQRAAPSTTTAVLALAARKRGVPCEALSGPYLRLGHGAAQRLVYASVTERTSLAASQLARNKHRTNKRLAEQRLPVTRQILVATPEAAIAAAESIGYPVVVKPMKEKQGAGVSVGIARPEHIPEAFARAQRANHRTIIESFVPGDAYRLLVIGGRFIAALKTVPAAVTGDGERTIAALIDELNRDPARDGVHLFPVKIDDDLEADLRLAGYALDHVLEKGRTIAVRGAANVALGGLHSDATETVHPDNQELAIRATEAIGLDVAGVDFVTADISRSHREAGGSIIEVNARPGFCMPTCPLHGKSRHAAGAFLDLLFPPGTKAGRIPIALVAGEQGTARVARDVDALLRAAGRKVGLATRKAALLNGQPAQIAKNRRRRVGPLLLRDPHVQTVVSTVSLRRALKRGLGFDNCDAAAIVSRSADRDRLDVLVRATRGPLVVSGDNEPVLQALSGLDPQRLILLGSRPQDLQIARHVAAGGAVVLNVRERDQQWIVVYRDGRVLVSIRVAEAGARISARRLETRMFAVALAFAIGLPVSDIEAAAASIRPVTKSPASR